MTKASKWDSPYIRDKDNNVIGRKCSVCDRKLGIESFDKDSSTKYGFYPLCKTCRAVRALNYNKFRYKLNYEIYTNKLNEQNNKCMICNKEFVEGLVKPVIDHCHKTGKFRGILCSKCNIGIGHLQEDKYILLNAIKYLEEHK